MGTRCVINFYDDNASIEVWPSADKNTEQKSILVAIYHQFDGYPEDGVGEILAKFLVPRKLLNGIGCDDTTETSANGMGCLAAQYIAQEKFGVGGVYIYPIGVEDGIEYIYHVFHDGVVLESYEEILFSGSWNNFLKFCCKEPFQEANNVEWVNPPVRQILLELLYSRIVDVRFIKQDGSAREMKATTCLDIIIEDENYHLPLRINKHHNEDQIRVWDVEKKEWRSFLYNRVLAIR